MRVYLGVILAVSAGVITGSFATPSKHIRHYWSFENIWLFYAFWAFLVFPISTAFFFNTNPFHLYSLIPNNLVWIMIVGGAIYGLGQIGLAYAIHSIGIGLTFTIVVGLSTTLGFLLPLLLQHTSYIFTLFDLFTLVGISIVLLGLVLSAKAGKKRHILVLLTKKFIHGHNKFIIGILSATAAGVSASVQNLTFSLTKPMENFALATHVSPFWAANIIWPGFLLAAFMPYFMYMIYRHIKNQSYLAYKHSISCYYFLLTFMMGAFWFFALLLYGKSTLMIGTLGPVIGWPLFMIAIILTSNFWGWVYNEWKYSSKHVLRLLKWSLVCFIIAFIFLGASVKFKKPTTLTSQNHHPLYHR